MRKEGFTILGVGAVACLVCCAGPILGALGGITLAGLASTVVIGASRLVIALIAGAAWLVVRRQRRRAITKDDSTGFVAVGRPTRRS